MIAIPSRASTSASRRRGSLLLASCLSRAVVASAAIAVIWLATGWAMGWW
ncbi:hypothetical protein H0A73_01735 [Alcaligenaceae bacterium]|nr:hypothetical protein [Alcaligenaceae bacterium]